MKSSGVSQVEKPVLNRAKEMTGIIGMESVRVHKAGRPISPEKKEGPLERISQSGHLTFCKIKSRPSF